MAGTWRGTLLSVPFTMTLDQPAGGVITGSWNLPTVGLSGVLDPAALNRIDAAGAVSMRCKVTQGGGRFGFDDFTFTGTMDTTGSRINGGVRDSGFSGETLVLIK